MLVGSDQLQHRPAPSAPRAEPDDVDDDGDGDVEVEAFRDIHPEPSPPHLPPPLRQPSWDAASHRSLSSSGVGGGGDAELFATMSREFTAMVAAGSSSAANPDVPGDAADLNLLQLSRISEHELAPPTDETNALAIVPAADSGGALPAPVEQVKKEEVEAKVAAWQAEEVAKINNKFKREEVVINGWESQQVDKANAWLAKIERKLEEERAKATEKAQNEAAAARRKAEERRASAEARRGRKTAEVLDRANFCKAAGRVPSKRSFFSF
uniref:Remorin C-terminal domain-containing protein n=1 Tax=Oryza punctata TaxID=4537 RepID=A0A0E0LIE2_ORYPU